jgi:hypothetical protein
MNLDLQILEVTSSDIPSSGIISVEQVCQIIHSYLLISSDEY